MFISKWLANFVRYEKEVAKEGWSASLTRHVWWKGVSASLVVLAVTGVLVSDLSMVVGESSSRHGIRAATLALGVAVMVFVSMIPKSNRRLDLFIRILSGGMAIAAAAFWLLGETDGRIRPVLLVVIPTVSAMLLAGLFIIFSQSMLYWETAIKRRNRIGDTQSEEGEEQREVIEG